MGFTEILEAQDIEPAEGTKTCCRCKVTQELSEFNKDSKTRDGLSPYCKTCAKVHRLAVKCRPKERVTEKRCLQCGEVKPRQEFSKDMGSRDGLGRRCTTCRQIYRRETKKTDPSRPERKQCSQCGQVKQQQEFYKVCDKRDGLTSACKECLRLHERVTYILRQALRDKPGRGPGIVNWEQTDSALREMAELQIMVNREKAQCAEYVRQIKNDAAETIKPFVLSQSRIQLMIERFVKRARRDCKRLHRSFRFGSVSFHRNRIDIRLNIALAQERLGLP